MKRIKRDFGHLYCLRGSSSADGRHSGPEARGCLTKENPPRMTFAGPASFFQSISIIFGEAGLIFEDLKSRGGCGKEEFCQGLPGVNPQRSNQGMLLRNLFWEMLFQKEAGTALG